MANEVTPIVTKLTLVELSILVAANGLEEGLQYLVTDKDWLLTATSVNTLKASMGTLIVLLPNVLPDYITTEILIIDSGEYNPSITQYKEFLSKPNFMIDKVICENRSLTLVSEITVIDSDLDESVGVTSIPATKKLCFKDIGYTFGIIKIVEVGHSYKVQIIDSISAELSAELHRVVIFFIKTYN